jgi:hypothetical protein
MAHGTVDNIMMLTMSVAMLTMVMSMLIMGVYWGLALLVLSGVLTGIITVYYSFQSARCMCGTTSRIQLEKKGISEDSCGCEDV